MERLVVRKLRGVPERHCLIVGSLERGNGSVGDWDIVSCVASLPSFLVLSDE